MAARIGLNTREAAGGSAPLDLVAIGIISVLGLYTVIDAAVLRVAAGQRIIYAGIAGIVAASVLLGWMRIRLPRPVAASLVVWMLLLIAWLLPVLGSEQVYPGYVAGDFASMAMPALFLLAAYAVPDMYRNPWYLGLLAGWLLMAMVAGMLLGTGWGGRFEPPHNLLVVLLWFGVFAGGRGIRWLCGGLLVVVLLLAFQSGARTVVVLWFAGLAYLLALRWPVRHLVVAAVPLGAVIVLFAGAALQQALLDTLAQSRFRQNIEGEADVSLISRFNEAADIAAIVTEESSALQIVLGRGHGATFRPERSFPMHNFTVHGLVHHIHITPVMLLYRYGLLGIAVYVALIAFLVRRFFAERRHTRSRGQLPHSAVFTFAMVLYVADSLLRNPLVDPLLSWVLAGFLAYALSSRRQGSTIRVSRPSAAGTPA